MLLLLLLVPEEYLYLIIIKLLIIKRRGSNLGWCGTRAERGRSSAAVVVTLDDTGATVAVVAVARRMVTWEGVRRARRREGREWREGARNSNSLRFRAKRMRESAAVASSSPLPVLNDEHE